MKRFIIKTILFFAILVVVDLLAGQGFQYMEEHARTGFTQRDNYICDSLETDILLLGSSRCIRHYNPEFFSDAFGKKCYNAGQMGNGVILNFGRLRMINERQRPQLVVYDITPSFDLLQGEDNHKYLTWLKPHYDREGIPDIFTSVDKKEKYKMLSLLYRYNSRFIELTMDCFGPMQNARSDGFSPLKGDFNKSKIKLNREIPSAYNYDCLKMKYIQKLIREVGKEHIVFVVSPNWYGLDPKQFEPIRDMCKIENIPFIDFSQSEKYVRNNDYFKDGSHLNAIGADEFTKDFVAKVKELSII